MERRRDGSWLTRIDNGTAGVDAMLLMFMLSPPPDPWLGNDVDGVAAVRQLAVRHTSILPAPACLLQPPPPVKTTGTDTFLILPLLGRRVGREGAYFDAEHPGSEDIATSHLQFQNYFVPQSLCDLVSPRVSFASTSPRINILQMPERSAGVSSPLMKRNIWAWDGGASKNGTSLQCTHHAILALCHISREISPWTPRTAAALGIYALVACSNTQQQAPPQSRHTDRRSHLQALTPHPGAIRRLLHSFSLSSYYRRISLPCCLPCSPSSPSPTRKNVAIFHETAVCLLKKLKKTTHGHCLPMEASLPYYVP